MIKKILFCLLLATITSGLAQPGSASLTINTTPEWAGLAEGSEVTDFPVLVRLDGGYFDFSQVMSDGSDIRFEDSSGAALEFDLDHWDGTASTAAFWVKVPSIMGNSTQEITMTWGAANPPGGTNSQAVFDTAAGYWGVYHLDEDMAGTGNADVYKDATAMEVHGVDGVASTGKDGLIGNGQEFDSNKDYIGLGTGDPSDSALTVSSWVRWQGDDNSHHCIVSKRTKWDPTDGMRWQLVFDHKNDRLTFHGWHEDTPAAVWDDQVPDINQWTHVAVTWTPDSLGTKLYLNGVKVGEDQSNMLSGDTTAPMQIGQAEVGNSEGFNGDLDEVRIETVVRSPEWLKLSYDNQGPVQNLVSMPLTDGCTKAFTAPETIEANEGQSFSGSATVTCALRFNWLAVNGSVLTPLSLSGFAIEGSIPRIDADTTYNYKLAAEFTDGWDTLDVQVDVINNMPDPEYTIVAPTGVWDGNEDIFVTANISNLAAINALPEPYNDVTYAWSTSGITISKTGTTTDTLKLTRAYGDGTFEIRLCMNNGGASVCDTVSMEVLRPVVKTDDLLLGPDSPVGFVKGHLVWHQARRVQIWDVDGSLLINEAGQPGKRLQLQHGIVKGLKARRYQITVK